MAQAALANRQWHQPSAKPGNNWAKEEMFVFKITLESQDSATFFGVDPLPDPVNIPAAILTDLLPNEGTQDRETYRFLRLMEQAMRSAPTESAVIDFAQAVLQLMHYDDPGFIVRSHVDLPFPMCGGKYYAQTDLCVVDKHEVLLVFKEDAAYSEAQLVADAIAAFYLNNRLRGENHLPILKSRIMAGMTMCGTLPMFYKIPITQDLVDCVLMGLEPMTETKVLKHVPLFPDRFINGMPPLGNRLLALKCYDAFKAFVFGDHSV
jgi:hypothetical protein